LLYTPTTEELTEAPTETATAEEVTKAPTTKELTQELTAPTEPATGKTKLNNFLYSAGKAHSIAPSEAPYLLCFSGT